MDSEVRWSPEAAQDLENLARFLEESVGLELAETLISRLYSKIEKLGRRPILGTTIAGDARQRILGNYRVVFRCGDVVEVLRIYHYRQDLQS